jgi:hypothetical protein
MRSQGSERGSLWPGWTAAAFTAMPAVWFTVRLIGGDSKALCIYMPHICIVAVTTALDHHINNRCDIICCAISAAQPRCLFQHVAGAPPPVHAHTLLLSMHAVTSGHSIPCTTEPLVVVHQHHCSSNATASCCWHGLTIGPTTFSLDPTWSQV